MFIHPTGGPTEKALKPGQIINPHQTWLVVESTPLKNMSSSVGIGMMKFPTEWKVIPIVLVFVDPPSIHLSHLAPESTTLFEVM